MDAISAFLLLSIPAGFACLLVVAYLLFRRMVESQTSTFNTALTEMRSVTQRVLILRGLNPHVVDHQTFGPSGMARQDEEKLAAKAESAQEAQASEEDAALREAEALHFRLLHEQLEAQTLGERRNTT